MVPYMAFLSNHEASNLPLPSLPHTFIREDALLDQGHWNPSPNIETRMNDSDIF